MRGYPQIGRYSPSFLWLLRDFYLNMSEDGVSAISPGDYLEAQAPSQPPTPPTILSISPRRSSPYPRRIFARVLCRTASRLRLSNPSPLSDAAVSSMRMYSFYLHN